MNKRWQTLAYGLITVFLIAIISLILMAINQSFAPLLTLVVFSILGFVSAHLNIDTNEKLKQALLENIIIILVLMAITRIGAFIVTFDLSIFSPVNLILSFMVYVGISCYISTLVYYIKGAL